MYRTTNIQEYNNLYNYLKNIAINNKDEANFCWDYYHKQNVILDNNQFLIDNTNDDVVEMGIGNLNSKVLIVIDTINNTDFINFFESVCKYYNVAIYDFYITPFNKCSVEQLNYQVLCSEINTLNPTIIITFSQFVNYIKHNSVIHFDKEVFNRMCYLEKLEQSTQQELNEYNNIKNYMYKIFSYMSNGYNPITTSV